MLSALAGAAIGVYVVLLLGMLVYGANSFILVVQHWRGRRRGKAPVQRPDPNWRVTVQLPVYNEENVVGRLLEAAVRLDWPADRLHIQLLDDSTDNTSAIAARHVQRLKRQGHRITHVRRSDRRGYKAGALAAGSAQTDGEFLAIFDADFVPPPDFLQRALGRFHDPKVACVQGRWGHLNRGWSGLTRAQALAIDGHFGVEQEARASSGWLVNFNGTCGVWRREAIDAAGGWSGDTLTEDLDLSYRVQLAGWRIAYDASLECPGELPTDLTAFKAQQRRWATGSMQCARKLLGAVWRSERTLATKLQATLHLTHYAVHPLIALTALLTVPCVLLPGAAAGQEGMWRWLLPFAVAMSGPTLLYLYGQRSIGRRALPAVRDLGLLTLVGVGMALSNARAVLEAFQGEVGEREFVRTPKLGGQGRDAAMPVVRYRAAPDGLRPAEVALSAYCLLTCVALLWTGVYVIAPFMLLDAAGFACVAVMGASP